MQASKEESTTLSSGVSRTGRITSTGDGDRKNLEKRSGTGESGGSGSASGSVTIANKNTHVLQT